MNPSKVMNKISMHSASKKFPKDFFNHNPVASKERQSVFQSSSGISNLEKEISADVGKNASRNRDLKPILKKRS